MSKQKRSGKAKSPEDLGPRQAIFVKEYLKDCNATQAAIRAGYSKKTADVQGPRLLGNVRVKAAIDKALQARSERTDIKADQVLREIARLAFADVRQIADWGPGGVVLKESKDLTDDVAACVAEVSEHKTEANSNVRLKLHNKIEALKLLGRHVGLFKGGDEESQGPTFKVYINVDMDRV